MITKDYTKLFLAMYNSAHHVCKNFHCINSESDPIEFGGYKFLLTSYLNNTRFNYNDYNGTVAFSVFRTNFETETKNRIQIHYKDNGTNKVLNIIKEFQDEGEALYYIVGTDIPKEFFPLSKDFLFNLSTTNFPVALYSNVYEKMVKHLDISSFSMIFRMDF